MLCTEGPMTLLMSACKKSYPSTPEMMLAFIQKMSESRLTVLSVWPYLKPFVRLIQK